MKIGKLLQERDGEMYFIRPDATLAETVETLNAKHVGALAVLDEIGQLLGVVSERDIMRKGYDPDRKTINCTGLVRDAMRSTSDLPLARVETELRDVMAMMQQKHTRHVVVIDEIDKPMGVISIRDIVGKLIDMPLPRDEEL